MAPHRTGSGFLIVAVATAVLPTTAAAAETLSGRVVGITDGDTITVLRNGQAVEMRWGRGKSAACLRF